MILQPTDELNGPLSEALDGFLEHRQLGLVRYIEWVQRD
jgi:hypothetical protein